MWNVFTNNFSSFFQDILVFISPRVEATFLSMNAVIGTLMCDSLALGGNATGDQLSYPLFFFSSSSRAGIQYRIESSLHLKCSIQEIWYKKVCSHVKYYLSITLNRYSKQPFWAATAPDAPVTGWVLHNMVNSFGYRQDTEDTRRGSRSPPVRGCGASNLILVPHAKYLERLTHPST